MSTISISYPSTIPLPVTDYSGAPRNTTLVSQPAQGVIARRSRFVKAYTQLQVNWMLTDSQYLALSSFFSITLYNGSACFKMELRYPRNTELEMWVVRFLEGLQATRQDGFWNVRTTIDLIRNFLGPTRVDEDAEERLTEDGDLRVIEPEVTE